MTVPQTDDLPEVATVSDVPDDYLMLEGTHSRDTALQHVGLDPDDYSHGSLFVQTAAGEYTDILFFGGCVPYLQKRVTRIYPGGDA